METKIQNWKQNLKIGIKIFKKGNFFNGSKLLKWELNFLIWNKTFKLGAKLLHFIIRRKGIYEMEQNFKIRKNLQKLEKRKFLKSEKKLK